MAVNSLLARIALPKKPANWTHLTLTVEIWEGDEHSKSQFSESGDSLNGQNLCTELPFL